MLDYREEILDHYKHPRNFGELNDPTHQARGANASCGDMIEMQLRIKDGKVEEIKWRGVGCALSTAGASRLSEILVGKKVEEIGKWDNEKMTELMGEVNVGRKKCVNLGLRVLKEALNGKIGT